MYINKIKINEVRHLKNFEINLGDKKKHLILTGKNGSGKTTLLGEISNYMEKVNNKQILQLESYNNGLQMYIKRWETLSSKIDRSPKEENDFQQALTQIEYYNRIIKEISKIEISFDNLSMLMEKLNSKEFIIKMFKTKRQSNMTPSHGVEIIDLENLKSSNNQNSQAWFLKYMVHLKTQLAYAVTDDDQKEINRIKSWFNRFEELLQTIFETENIRLVYDRKKYNFIIEENNKKFDFNTLSDGFSAVLDILTGIMMVMEKEEEELHNYDMCGIVLIDELDTHLHISLQQNIFKVLTEFFPNIQFIITTHSPFILNSVKDSIIFDLEIKEEIEDLTNFSYETLVEGYFKHERYTQELKEKIDEYERLAFKNKTEEENDRFYDLRNELVKIDSQEELQKKFEEIEVKRKNV